LTLRGIGKEYDGVDAPAAAPKAVRRLRQSGALTMSASGRISNPAA